MEGAGKVGLWNRGKVDGPETVGGGRTGTTKKDIAMESDVDLAGGESGGAAGVAELTNGDEGCISKGREEMSGAG